MVHQPISVYPSQNGANRCQITTWGLPTAVAAPGNSQGNTPNTAGGFTGSNSPIPVETYAHIGTGDTCAATFIPALTDRSIQVVDTGSGTVNITGSNDGVNYVTLHGVDGTALSALAKGSIVQIAEECSWIQPVPTGMAAMDIILVGKKPF